MNYPSDKDKVLVSAVKKYALENDIQLNAIQDVLNNKEFLKDKVSALSETEINSIKSMISKEELEQLTKLINEVK